MPQNTYKTCTLPSSAFWQEWECQLAARDLTLKPHGLDHFVALRWALLLVGAGLTHRGFQVGRSCGRSMTGHLHDSPILWKLLLPIVLTEGIHWTATLVPGENASTQSSRERQGGCLRIFEASTWNRTIHGLLQNQLYIHTCKYSFTYTQNYISINTTPCIYVCVNTYIYMQIDSVVNCI